MEAGRGAPQLEPAVASPHGQHHTGCTHHWLALPSRTCLRASGALPLRLRLAALQAPPAHRPPGAGPESRVPAAQMLLLLLLLQGRQARGSAARQSRLHSVPALGGAGRVGKGCTRLPTDAQFGFRRGESSEASANPGALAVAL